MKLQRTGTAADMVEMEMRFDDEIDARRVAPDRFEPRADLFARIKADPEQRGDPGAKAPLRIMPAIGMETGIEQGSPFLVLDQSHRYRHPYAALAAGGRNRRSPGRR
jgi:hypothetical protein